MKFQVLATDYDGTLAHHGDVAPSTLEALTQFKKHGGKLILVTGRELPELQRVFPGIAVFDRVVAENGALLARPDTGETRAICEAPPRHFIDRLRERGVKLISVGQVIVASQEIYYGIVLEEIAHSKLPLHISLNKGALMILPDGVNKACGLREVLAELRIDLSQVAGVGDAENDLSFLRICGLSAVVANALEHLKPEVDLVLQGRQGIGVEELIQKLLQAKPLPLIQTGSGSANGSPESHNRTTTA